MSKNQMDPSVLPEISQGRVADNVFLNKKHFTQKIFWYSHTPF